MRKLIIPASVIVAVLSALFPRSVYAADDSVLLFSGWDYKNKQTKWDIYRTTLTGDSKVVVNSPASESYVFSFPGGRSAGYLLERPKEQYEIFKVDLESGQSTSTGITIGTDTRCQVSPNQKELACDDRDRTLSQIVVFDLATKEKKQITSFKNNSQYPSWSPDGEKLVYWTGAEAAQVGKDAKPKGIHLAIYSFETNESSLLTKEPRAYDAAPQWSPDGKWIAFERKGKSRGEWNIWVIRPDGTEATQLTNEKFENTYPVWSPDSKQLAFQCYRRNSDTFDICGVEVSTKRGFSVTDTPKVDERQPAWIK